MTFEECVKILPDELEKIGYKTRPARGSSFDTTTTIMNFHLDNTCNDCLINPQRKREKCICFANQIHATDWNRYFYSEFSDEVYNKLMTAARNMVAQYRIEDR